MTEVAGGGNETLVLGPMTNGAEPTRRRGCDGSSVAPTWLVVLTDDSDIAHSSVAHLPLVNQAIRIVIVDDSDIVRRGVTRFLALRSDFLVVGEAENGRAAIELARHLQPDVVLLDIAMPVLDGVAAARVLVRLEPPPAVVLFSAWADPDRLSEATAAGVYGHILKDAPI